MSAGAVSKPGRIRAHLVKVASLAGALVVALLIVEVLARVFFNGEVDSALLRARLKKTSVRNLVVPSQDPILLYEVKPNLAGDLHNVALFTDGFGCRVPAAPAAPAAPHAGAVRRALLGDSSSFGWGIPAKETYGELLHAAIENDMGTAVELRNFSVPGYNAVQATRLFEQRSVPWRPDMVIVHHDHNDGDPAALDFLPPGTLHPDYGDNPLHSAAWKLCLRRLRRWVNLRNERAAARQHDRVDGYIASGPFHEMHLEARRQLVERARELDIPVEIVLFNANVPADPDYESSARYQRLHRDKVIRNSHVLI